MKNESKERKLPFLQYIERVLPSKEVNEAPR